MREVWKAIDLFLADTEGGRKSVEQLFATLRHPPFGLKDGVLPVVLAAVLVHAPARVALYEEGSFVPRPSAAAFERLVRSPSKFEVRLAAAYRSQHCQDDQLGASSPRLVFCHRERHNALAA